MLKAHNRYLISYQIQRVDAWEQQKVRNISNTILRQSGNKRIRKNLSVLSDSDPCFSTYKGASLLISGRRVELLKTQKALESQSVTARRARSKCLIPSGSAWSPGLGQQAKLGLKGKTNPQRGRVVQISFQKPVAPAGRRAWTAVCIHVVTLTGLLTPTLIPSVVIASDVKQLLRRSLKPKIVQKSTKEWKWYTRKYLLTTKKAVEEE